MAKIRVKLDLPYMDAIRLSAAMADDVYECERMARFYDEKEKPAYSKFYRMLADQSRTIKEALDLQIGNGDNVYIGGDEDESART